MEERERESVHSRHVEGLPHMWGEKGGGGDRIRDINGLSHGKDSCRGFAKWSSVTGWKENNKRTWFSCHTEARFVSELPESVVCYALTLLMAVRTLLSSGWESTSLVKRAGLVSGKEQAVSHS